MWCGRNIGCGLTAALLLAGAPVVEAQDGVTSQTEPGAPAREPDASDALAALDLVEAWVRDWAVSATDAALAGQAAAVTIRADGAVVGRSADHGRGAGALEVAAARAITQAERALGVSRDAVSRAQGEQTASRTTVSVQLAGAMVPMSKVEVAIPDEHLSRGLEGVAARLGDRWALEFPSTFYETRRTYRAVMASLAVSLVGQSELGAMAPSTIADEHGVRYYRFRVKHVARPAPGVPPVLLHRGSALPRRGAIGPEGAHALATGCVRHFGVRLAKAGGMVPGSLDPLTGESEGVASDKTQSLALLALRRAAGAGRVLSSAPEASRVFDYLAATLAADEAFLSRLEDEPAAAAWVWIATEGVVPDSPGAALRARAGEALDALSKFASETEWRGTQDEAVYLWGAIDWAQEQGLDTAGPERGLRSVLTAAGPSGLGGILPWAYYADRELHRDRLPSATAMRAVRAEVWERQITLEDGAGGDEDFVGAIMQGPTIVPGASCAGLLTFGAAAMRDPDLTLADERSHELLAVLSGLAFLDQLAAGVEESHMWADRELAFGGVRATPWEQTMSPEAAAMTLLAAVETLESLGAMAGEAP